MRLSDFDFDLPDALIARFPAEPRDESRLLVVSRKDGSLAHQRFWSLPSLLEEGDVLVLNNTRVLPARIFGTIDSKQTEVLLLERLEDSHWSCLVRPGRRVTQQTTITFGDGSHARLCRADHDTFHIQFSLPSSQDLDWIQTHGQAPLPPYLKRPFHPRDRDSYQTVFAKIPGSVAAPTAGLHFTPALLQQLKDQGTLVEEITLHVGYGTFAPIRTENLEEVTLHEEFYSIRPSVLEAIQTARLNKKRVIAVGTSSLRALESIDSRGLSGRTDLFIAPGHRFRWVDGLVTNFHLPKSSLLILVSSLLGHKRTQDCYREAVGQGYRFYSYGDAMLIVP